MKKKIVLMTTFVILAGSGILYAFNSNSTSASCCAEGKACCTEQSCGSDCSCGSECSGTGCECGCECCK